MFFISTGINLYLLQSNLDYFGNTFRSRETNPLAIIFFAIGVAVIVIILVAANAFKKKLPLNAVDGIKTSGPSEFHPFSAMALHRQLGSMGLSRDQIKILDFVFKHDNVANPEHSLKSPELLDRHFKKAYRIIEKSASTDDEAQQRLGLLFSVRNILESQSSVTTNSTRHLPENTDAVIGYKNENYPIKVLSTKGDCLVVENPHNALGSHIQIPRGSNVTLSFFTRSNKGFAFESRILGMSDSGGRPVLQLLHSNQVRNLSKRRFRRRNVAVSAFFYFVNLEDSGRKEKRMVVDKRRLTGNIMDISIGGCSIKTNVLVPSGTLLKIEAVYGGNNIAVLGKVLRTNRSGTKTIVHIIFQKVPRRSLNAINAIVYEYADD